MLPPATPPLRSSTSDPGLLTSKDRMTIIRGSDTKSRRGTGIFFVTYSHRTYIHIYLDCLYRKHSVIANDAQFIPCFLLSCYPRSCKDLIERFTMRRIYCMLLNEIKLGEDKAHGCVCHTDDALEWYLIQQHITIFAFSPHKVLSTFKTTICPLNILNIIRTNKRTIGIFRALGGDSPWAK